MIRSVFFPSGKENKDVQLRWYLEDHPMTSRWFVTRLSFGPLSRIVLDWTLSKWPFTPWKKKMRVILTTGSNWDDPPSRYLKKFAKTPLLEFPGHHQRDKYPWHIVIIAFDCIPLHSPPQRVV